VSYHVWPRIFESGIVGRGASLLGEAIYKVGLEGCVGVSRQEENEGNSKGNSIHKGTEAQKTMAFLDSYKLAAVGWGGGRIPSLFPPGVAHMSVVTPIP
jgi:hypothetical protein